MTLLQTTTPKSVQAKTRDEVREAVCGKIKRVGEVVCVEKCENDPWQPFNPDAGYEVE